MKAIDTGYIHMFPTHIYEDKWHDSFLRVALCTDRFEDLQRSWSTLASRPKKQLVLRGDFYLVAACIGHAVGEAGENVYICKYVQSMHHVDMKSVKRQHCAAFIRAVRNVATGECFVKFACYVHAV